MYKPLFSMTLLTTYVSLVNVPFHEPQRFDFTIFIPHQNSVLVELIEIMDGENNRSVGILHSALPCT